MIGFKKLAIVLIAVLVTLVVTIGEAPLAEAATANRCHDYLTLKSPSRLTKWYNRVTRIKEKLVPKLLRGIAKIVTNRERQKVSLSGTAGGSVDMDVGDRLGMGMSGSVYDITSIKFHGPAQPLPSEKMAVVAKFPHVMRWAHAPLNRAQISNEAEVQLYEAGVSLWERHREAHVQDGRELPPLPVVPIVASLETDLGTIILKPRVSGKSLWQMNADGYLIRPEFLDQVRRFFSVIDEFESVVQNFAEAESTPDSMRGRRSFDLDINARNLVWLDKAETQRLRNMGIEMGFEEGLALFEITFQAQPDGRTLESYIAELHEAVTYE